MCFSFSLDLSHPVYVHLFYVIVTQFVWSQFYLWESSIAFSLHGYWQFDEVIFGTIKYRNDQK